MNTHKKTLLIVGIALATTQAYGLSVTELRTFFEKEILNQAQHNLFGQRQEQIFNNLATASTIIKGYIIEEAGNDSALMKTLAELDQARIVLVNAMKLGYNNFFTQPPKQIDSIEKEIALKIAKNLKIVESDAPNIIKRIKNVTFFIPNKKTAREFLELLGRVIALIAKAAHEDFTMGIAKQLQMDHPQRQFTQPRILRLN